jgi:hypothetical protein
MVANVALVAFAAWLLPRGNGEISVPATLFFLTMISLLTTFHDRWFPVHALRVREAEALGPTPVQPTGQV